MGGCIRGHLSEVNWRARRYFLTAAQHTLRLRSSARIALDIVMVSDTCYDFKEVGRALTQLIQNDQ